MLHAKSSANIKLCNNPHLWKSTAFTFLLIKQFTKTTAQKFVLRLVTPLQ